MDKEFTEKIIANLERRIQIADDQFEDFIGLQKGTAREILETMKDLLATNEWLEKTIRKYELEKGWEENPDRMNGGGWQNE